MVRRPATAATTRIGRDNPVVDIFDEIDEELRAERAQRLLRRYAGLIVVVALLIVGSAAGWEAWRYYQAKQDMLAAQHYMGAVGLANSPGAGGNQAIINGDFETLASTAPEGYRTLSRLQGAAFKAQHGDLKAALDLWNAVATDTSADPLLRDLATLLLCQHQIDTGDPALLAARLKALAEPGNAWRPLAQEQLALLDLRQGKTEAAKTALRALVQDVTAPNGVRERAAALLAQLA
jgi:hypothetical protein